MSWHALEVAPCLSHHLRNGQPAYTARFDEVLKFHPPGLAAVRRQGEAWHIGADGSPAYAPRFQRTFGFYEDRAAVVADSGCHHILASGEALYPERYAWCGNFQGARCSVRQPDGQYLHLTAAGEPAYAERWRYAGDYRDGVAVVQGESGLSTHIDRDGRLLHQRWFLDLDVFHKGYARARDEAGWVHIDRNGRPLYATRFASIEPFYNGQARVERFDGGLEVIDEQGVTRLELRPARRSEFAALSADMVGFWRTQTIAAVVEFGVVEALPGSEVDVAMRCGLRPGGARRLLRAAGELGLVTEEAGVWQRSPRGDYLRADHPETLAGAAREYARAFSRMWDALPAALSAQGGWSAPDIFGEVAADGARCQSHHRMLQSYARHDYPLLPRVLGLAGHERVIDAGGGLGVFANLLLDEYPGLEVVVFDRGEVVRQGRAENAQRRGLSWCDGDLFEPWNLQADAVVLARVLHDWDDTAAQRILRQAREALVPGGRVYILEMVLPEQGYAGGLCDLHLLAVTGGQERTEDDYRKLLTAEQFELVEVRRTPALPSVIVGVAR